MPEAFVGVGSNTDPARAIRAALTALEQRFGGLRCSTVYRSPAVGVPAAAYLNLVVTFATAVDAQTLRQTLAGIEAVAGRRRDDPAVCRLDLDLLLYGCTVDAERRLPRVGVFTQPFVLGPLAEIAPGLVHPLTGQRCADAWASAGRPRLENVGTVASLG